MAKYIDADRLIEYLEKDADKEFKKTEENANSPVLCHFHNGCRMQALDTIDFIKELQQEQPEKNVEKVCGTCAYWQEGTLDRGKCQAGEPHQTHSAETCERWERHEEIPLEEQHSEELEVEIEKFLASEDSTSYDNAGPYKVSFKDPTKIARHFAEWQKEQMLKDAVKGTVCKDKKSVWIELIPNALPDYEDIEPVKCVVMKED